MCKKAAYTQKFFQYADYAYIRIAFFSFPSFYEKFLEYKSKIWSRYMSLENFVDKPLTALEQQLVDVDSTADDLDITIDNIITKNVYTFSDVHIGAYSANIFLSQYFLFIQIRLDGRDIDKSIYKDISDLITFDGFNEVSLKRIELGLWHKAKLKKEELWDVLDQMAFKGIDEEVSVNGLYYDGYGVDGNFIEARRSLRRLKDDNTYLATMLVWTNLDEYTIETQELAWDLLKHESTRCFTK